MSSDEKDREAELAEQRNLAITRGIDLLFDTPPERMKELTQIGRRQSLSMSMMRTYDDLETFLAGAMEGKKDAEAFEEELSLSAQWLNYYEQYQRSVGGSHRRMLGEITMEQIGTDADDDEDEKWRD